MAKCEVSKVQHRMPVRLLEPSAHAVNGFQFDSCYWEFDWQISEGASLGIIYVIY